MKTSPVAYTHARAHMYTYRGEASGGGASCCVVVMACSTHTRVHTCTHTGERPLVVVQVVVL